MAENIICCFFSPAFPREYPVRPDEAFCAAAAEEHDGDLGRRAGRVRRNVLFNTFGRQIKKGICSCNMPQKATPAVHTIAYRISVYFACIVSLIFNLAL